jgi:hypothetical protein
MKPTKIMLVSLMMAGFGKSDWSEPEFQNVCLFSELGKESSGSPTCTHISDLRIKLRLLTQVLSRFPLFPAT